MEHISSILARVLDHIEKGEPMKDDQKEKRKPKENPDSGHRFLNQRSER